MCTARVGSNQGEKRSSYLLAALPLKIPDFVVLDSHQLKPHQCFRTRKSINSAPKCDKTPRFCGLGIEIGWVFFLFCLYFDFFLGLGTPAGQSIFNFELIISMERQIS